MNWPHLIILPVVLPLACGALLLFAERRGSRRAPDFALAAVLAQIAVAVALALQAAQGPVQAYLVGNWQAPFGIALALDRLAALMLVLAAVIALASLLYARRRDAERGAHFHALLQFQLMGLNGAFLTADLFNLFVFFEVLLIASYALLLHGAGRARLRAAVHYVTFNLAGSALFLVAVSLLYALTGTLNLADLALRVPQVAGEDAVLLRSAALLLLVVFCVKAALLPLYFWLPETYGAATAPVAALFAIMTKVGVYAIARVYTLVFGDAGGAAAQVAWPWLPLLALATLALGAVGALAATRLRGLVAYLVVGSAGTLLLALGLGSAGTVAAGLFYLVHSTLTAAALFLIVDRVSALRGDHSDRLQPATPCGPATAAGAAFFFCAVAAAGLPPLTGFLGKALLLDAAPGRSGTSAAPRARGCAAPPRGWRPERGPRPPAGARARRGRRTRAGRFDQAPLRGAADGDLRTVTAAVLPVVIGAFALAMLLAAWRLLRGPSLPDRILALDTLYIDSLALLVLVGVYRDTPLYFEAALVISMLGFVGTVVLSKYLMRGDIAE